MLIGGKHEGVAFHIMEYFGGICICLSCMVEIGSYEPLPDLLFSWGSVAAEFEWRARIQNLKPFNPQARSLENQVLQDIGSKGRASLYRIPKP